MSGNPEERPASGGTWARVLWLDRELREGRYPSLRDLQEEFDISRRAAFNTVDYLRYSLGAPLEYCRKRKGYRYEDPTYALPSVFLQEGELLALLLAEEVTRQYLGTGLEAPLRAAVE
jgi:predicted DNA-binding transcriptional regulator YafY